MVCGEGLPGPATFLPLLSSLRTSVPVLSRAGSASGATRWAPATASPGEGFGARVWHPPRCGHWELSDRLAGVRVFWVTHLAHTVHRDVSVLRDHEGCVPWRH